VSEPDFSGPGQYALGVILALAMRAPTLAAQARAEDYQRLADLFRSEPPNCRADVERLSLRWLGEFGERVALDPMAAMLAMSDTAVERPAGWVAGAEVAERVAARVGSYRVRRPTRR